MIVLALHDPWMARCLGEVLPEAPVLSFGGPREAALWDGRGVPLCLVPPTDEPSTGDLLEDEDGAAFVRRFAPARLVVFKPAARLEAQAAALGASLLHPPAGVAQAIENKLALRAIAAHAGIDLPRQGEVRLDGSLHWRDLVDRYGARLVLQSPRGYMGKRTFAAESSEDLAAIVRELDGRPAKATEWVEGRPGTLNAVVDCGGNVVCTSPIVQLTGIPTLTPFPLGSCGNDFTWRPPPDPGDGAARIAQRLGPVLAERGFRGHFGIDFVVRPDGRCALIEINPRLTASMALYSAWAPALALAHFAAMQGETIASAVLPAVAGGQAIAHNVTDAPCAPLDTGLPIGRSPHPSAPRELWPAVARTVSPGAARARIVTRDAVVSATGQVLLTPPSGVRT